MHVKHQTSPSHATACTRNARAFMVVIVCETLKANPNCAQRIRENIIYTISHNIECHIFSVI